MVYVALSTSSWHWAPPVMPSLAREEDEEVLLASSAHFLEKAPCIDPPILSVIYAGAVNARRDTEVAVRSAVDGRNSL